MKTLLGLAFAVALSASAALASPYVKGESLPMEGLGKYSDYRAALLAEGWKPVANDLNQGSYEFPEVLCGSGLCTADWRSVTGLELSFTLWRPDGEHLVVAPAYEDGF